MGEPYRENRIGRTDRDDPNHLGESHMREPAEGPYGPNQLWALTRLRPLFMRIACSAPALESSRENERYDIEQYHMPQNKQQIIKSQEWRNEKQENRENPKRGNILIWDQDNQIQNQY